MELITLLKDYARAKQKSLNDLEVELFIEGEQFKLANVVSVKSVTMGMLEDPSTTRIFPHDKTISEIRLSYADNIKVTNFIELMINEIPLYQKASSLEIKSLIEELHEHDVVTLAGGFYDTLDINNPLSMTLDPDVARIYSADEEGDSSIEIKVGETFSIFALPKTHIEPLLDAFRKLKESKHELEKSTLLS